jgi:hypothetical protein
MVSPLTHAPTVLAAYLRDGEEGLAEVADRLEEAAHDRPNRKFSKRRALYLPQAPVPPTVWRTSCGRCRFWEAGAPGEPGECHVVGREDDPFGGEAIHYRGWCAFWMPPKGEPAFAWIRERLRPSGKTTVRGKYDPELTERERRREERAALPTEPDARRAAVCGDGDEAEADGDEAERDADGTSRGAAASDRGGAAGVGEEDRDDGG